MADGLKIIRNFDAPRERVFAAWTAPADFSTWFGSDAVEVPLDSLSLDAQAGRTWTALMKLPDGNTMNWGGEFNEVTPPNRLVFTITDNPSEPARELITVDLEDTGAGTKMTMTQTGGNLTEEQYAQTVVGYNAFFDTMERLVTS